MHRRLILTVVSISLLLTSVAAADWPAYRHDGAGSGVTDATLETPLHLQWTYQAPAPSPAWPEPGRELNRLAFDYAYQVTVANGIAYFGSSTDHKVTALDLATGAEKWSVFTDGPVRFAPVVDGGRVFVASDDGRVHCLAADDGERVWRKQLGQGPEKLMGNGQLISRWPLRAGVAVDDGIVYAAAGMWPQEGVFVYALNADDGETVWVNDTSGMGYIPQPHPPSRSFTGVTPQGQLVLANDQVFVPTGRSMAAAYDKATGELQYYRGAPDTWGDRWGGSWNMTSGDLLLGWTAHQGPDIAPKLGESDPWPGDGMVAWTRANGQKKVVLPSKLRAVIDSNTCYASGGGNVTAYDWPAVLGGKAPADCVKWETPHERAYELIKAGDTLAVGGRGTVTMLSAKDGSALSQQEVEGQVRGLAAADGKLLASTNTGAIHCFGVDEVEAKVWDDQARPPRYDSTLAADILEATGVTEGYAVVLDANEDLIGVLQQEAGLRVWAVDDDGDATEDLRQSLDATGVYGTHVVATTAARTSYPSYLADLVVAGGAGRSDATEAADLYRLVRPSGGVAYITTDDPSATTKWLRKGGVPAEEIAATKHGVMVARGALPGAGDWTHQYADAGKTGASTDTVVKLPVKLQWFGDPGPEKLVSRHWQGPSPLSIGGRLFVFGENIVLASDMYNGRPLWEREFTGIGRHPVSATGTGGAADEDSLYVTLRNTCHRLDAATGETLNTYELPSIEGVDPKDLRWHYVAVDDETVLGTAANADGGVALFARRKLTGDLLWTYVAEEAINHDGVAVGDGYVYVMDKTSGAELGKMKRRGERPVSEETLLALGLSDGGPAWTTRRGLGKRTDLRLGGDVLLATGGGRTTVFDATTGKMLRWSGIPMRGFPIIIGDTLYGEPFAYDIQTGEPRTREHPLTGTPVRWNFTRSYGCGVSAGSAGLLMFRSSTAGFCDLAADSGTYNWGGVRAGCYINFIAAGGVLAVPTGDAGCTCSYPFQTTVAMVPTESQDQWAVYSAAPMPKDQAIKRIALNLGAPGDRRDANGDLWLSQPRPMGPRAPAGMAVPATTEGGEYYRRSAAALDVAETSDDFLLASGVQGPARITVSLGNAEPKVYTVSLYFAELGGGAPGERVFDVKLQSETAVEGLDVAQEAGGSATALVRTVSTVSATDTLTVELVPRGGSRPPILSGVELVRQ